MPWLGLASREGQDPGVVGAAHAAGVRYFFYYDVSDNEFPAALAGAEPSRDEIVIASGTESRKVVPIGRKLGDLDVFFLEYVHPGESYDHVERALDEVVRWKEAERIRYVGATAHDRDLARRLVEDERVDVVMHRFNMAHRKAIDLVFPSARRENKPIVAFTATRWSSLLEGHPDWDEAPPTAGECYRYCHAYSEVGIVLMAPLTVDELRENVSALDAPAMTETERAHWDRYGDLIHGTGTDAFETQWP